MANLPIAFVNRPYLNVSKFPSRRLSNKQLNVFPVPRKLYTFNGDERYLNEGMFNSSAETMHTLHQWIPLSSGKADPKF